MIPKVINYCWFGRNPKPKSVIKCIESWKRICPDYTIREWNEDNYNIFETCDFVKDAYSKKMWAFVSDYARLDIIYHYGGVYLDTDVELLKPIDQLIKQDLGFIGFENQGEVNSGLGFAANKNDSIIGEMMEYYRKIRFDSLNPANVKCPLVNTEILVKHGLKCNNTFQTVGSLQILPTEYLCPENMFTGEVKYTINTISVHHYNASWMDKRSSMQIKAVVFLKRILPHQLVSWLQRFYRSFFKNKI